MSRPEKPNVTQSKPEGAVSSAVNLPAVLDKSGPLIDALVTVFKVPRDVLAPNDQIEHTWSQLPRVLMRIPPELRTQEFARMCVAVSCGLFDSAVNYVWNSTIAALRAKVRHFGLSVIAQIKRKPFEEKHLLELTDADLIALCLELNIITQEGFFFLDQCRDIRNNYSAAHPSGAMVDDHELISFLNRCTKYALERQIVPKGVDAQGFISALKANRFSADQKQKWVADLHATHDAQRRLLFGMLHGIYCDPASAEDTRLNSLGVVQECLDKMTGEIQSDLIDQHQAYASTGDTPRLTASRQFFERLGLLQMLNESERHSIISSACKNLLQAHQGFNNFYNEPPFAERLAELVRQGAVPRSAQYEFVTTTLACAVGNPYGYSWGAERFYQVMVTGFSQNEIKIMFEATSDNSYLATKLKQYASCKERFGAFAKLIDPNSVPTPVKAPYRKWIEGKA